MPSSSAGAREWRIPRTGSFAGIMRTRAYSFAIENLDESRALERLEVVARHAQPEPARQVAPGLSRGRARWARTSTLFRAMGAGACVARGQP
jgi:hypothetical protein